MDKRPIIALAGNPNSGKTTLFNALTGARQHVGNYPGVTVEKKQGRYLFPDGREAEIVDLPGTYSLTAYSVEELVARDFIVQERPDVVIDIVDASNLERNLYLTIQLMELGAPLVIALNMMDVAEDRGVEIDVERLSDFLQVPVVPIVARSGKNIGQLMEVAYQAAQATHSWEPLTISYGEDLDRTILEMERLLRDSPLVRSCPARWLAVKFLENDHEIQERGKRLHPELAERLIQKADEVAAHLKTTVDSYPEALIADHRYGFIKSLLRQNVLRQRFDTDRLYASDKIDKVLTNRFLGPLIMLMVLLGLYKFTFTYSELPVAWLEGFFGWMSGVVDGALPDGMLKSLLLSGVIDGVGGVLGFVPLIMFMFFGIAILEDSGYLARVAFMMDRVFRVFGLHGSSVMAFIVSGGIAGGCAVPGVMATRTLRSRKERLATLLTVPFMNCGAKLPVLALLTGTFFAASQAKVMFLLTLLAWGVALLVAKIYRMTVLKGESTPFVMELPPYRLPTFKGLLIHTWERTWQYIKKAGTVILAISILLWAMMTFPGLPASESERFALKEREIMASYPVEAVLELKQGGEAEYSAEAAALAEELDDLARLKAERALELSLAGRIGRGLESVSRFAGFDWRTNIALVGGFAAKEVVVSTLGTAYSLGEVDPEETEPLAARLANDPAWNPVKAFALILFVMFYAPCFVTVVCIAREAGSWKWAGLAITFNTLFAFALAVLVYQAGMALGWG